MSTLKVQLARVDLSGADSRNTLGALIRLLGPHVPYSLHILGTILNTGPRGSTLQHIDASKVTLWSTTPLRGDAISSPPSLFSIVTFSHLDHHFRFFCSGESRTSESDPPTEAEETHVKQVFEDLRDIAGEARPAYDSILTALTGRGWPRPRIDTDPPMIVFWAIHAKWAHVLAPMSTSQYPGLRYVFPRGAFGDNGLPLRETRWTTVRSSDDSGMDVDVEVSQIRMGDLPFVHGASSVPRSDAYILSRAPYSVCLRTRGETGTDGLGGRPVACAFMHSDGSIGALRVDPKYQRRGLGRLVIRALAEKLDFGNGQSDVELALDGYRDLGGGALGWNWTDTEIHNEAGNRFFTSLGGKESGWTGHWTYMLVNPDR